MNFDIGRKAEADRQGTQGGTPRLRSRRGRRDINWNAIEQDYRAGLLSLRELAEKHDCAHSTIANYAGRHCWTRN